MKSWIDDRPARGLWRENHTPTPFSRNHSSPLLVWKLLFVTVLIAFSAAILFDAKALDRERRGTILLDKLNKARIRPGRLRIVFLGNSLLKEAIPDSERRIEGLLSDQYEKKGYARKAVQIINLTYGAESPQMILALADRIFALKPDIIVIQAGMILDAANPPDILLRFQDWAFLLQKYFMARMPAIMRANRQQGDIAEIRRRLIAIAAGGLPGKAIVLKASFQGIRVISVEEPLSIAVAKDLPLDYYQKRSAAVRRISESAVSSVLRFPNPLPDEYFTDHRHTNLKGQIVFDQWFIPTLVQQIQEIRK